MLMNANKLLHFHKHPDTRIYSLNAKKNQVR